MMIQTKNNKPKQKKENMEEIDSSVEEGETKWTMGFVGRDSIGPSTPQISHQEQPTAPSTQ